MIMKNIYTLPTDKPSRIIFDFDENDYLPIQEKNVRMENQHLVQNRNIYITNDEEIKDGEWCLLNNRLVVRYFKPPVESKSFKKIILTTDKDLIKDGVQAIDDDFLKWFVKNPSCEEVKVEITEISCIIPNFEDVGKYKIIISKEEPKQDLEKEMFELEQELDIPSHLRWYNSKPKQETLINDTDSHSWGFENFEVIKTEEDAKIFVEIMENIQEPNDKLKKAFRDFNKQETLEEVAERFRSNNPGTMQGGNNTKILRAFKEGAKWQEQNSDKKWSEEDMREAFYAENEGWVNFDLWFEQFKNK